MENDTDQGMRLGVGCEKQTVGSGLLSLKKNEKKKLIRSLGTLGVALQSLLRVEARSKILYFAADNGALRLGRLGGMFARLFMQGVLM